LIGLRYAEIPTNETGGFLPDTPLWPRSEIEIAIE